MRRQGQLSRVPAQAVALFAKFLVFLSCLALLAMALHVTADVIWRGLFNTPILGTLEIGTHYYMIAVSFLALGYVQMKDGHVAVDFVVHNMKLRPRMVLEFFALFATFIFSLYYLYYSWLSAAQKTRLGEYVLVHSAPMTVWPSRWILVVSVFAFSLVLFIQLIRMGRALWQGRQLKVADLMKAELHADTGAND